MNVSAAEPVVIAHRGASDAFPENTIAAFQEAFRQGADAIEGDFRMTSDGEIVCIHDEHTGRVAPVKVTVSTSTYEMLRGLHIGGKQAAADSRIPTFAEVAKLVPEGRFFYVEIKGKVQMVPRLMEEIAKSDLKISQLRLISFHPEVIAEVKKRNPKIQAYWLVSRKRDRFGRVGPKWEAILQILESIQADGLSTKKTHVGAEDIQRVKAAGYSFHVWTVDDPELAGKFLRAGVESVTTNRPGDLVKWRAESGDGSQDP